MSERDPQQSSQEHFKAPKASAESYRHKHESEAHEQAEKQPQHAAESEATRARRAIEQHAQSSKEVQVGSGEQPKSLSENNSPAARNRTYQLTMQRLQSRMPVVQQKFSQFIHRPVVEKISEAASNTVARPSGVLGSGVLALLGMSFLYWLSRRSGFELSGSEFIIFILTGWLLGLLGELGYKTIKRLISG